VENEVGLASQSCSLRSTVDAVNASNERLTDGGYEESSSSYCFYAKRRYKQGEQVGIYFSFVLPVNFLLLKGKDWIPLLARVSLDMQGTGKLYLCQ
jgi:hypothetical protein